ncbi:MAG: hypothetical protein JO249_25050 [Acidobacteria bacterium]|nr:hypothetical protein [Acidobacteriota bacterium]
MRTQALRLSTVGIEVWPQATLLSAGAALALSSGHIRFAIFPNSGTAANLVRDGRLTLSLSLDGGMCELGMRARRCGQGTEEVPLAFFEVEVERSVCMSHPMRTLRAGSALPSISRHRCLTAGKDRLQHSGRLPIRPGGELK